MTDRGVLSCEDVHKYFEDAGQRLAVLKGVDVRVAAGETLAIVGASGSGKTTLLQILGGLDLPSSGHVRIDGRRIDELSDAERGRLRNQRARFRLPVPPPAAGVHGARERGDAAARAADAGDDGGRGGARVSGTRGSRPRACRTGRHSFRAESASAPRSRARS